MAKEVIYKISVDADVNDLVKLNNEIESLTKAQKELSSAKDKDNKALEENKQKLKALKDQYSQQSKAVQQQVKEQNNLVSVYEKESARLNNLRKQLKEMILSENASAKETKKLAKEVNNLDKKLKDADAAAGQFQRNVGNYPQKLRLATKDILKMALATVSLDSALSSITDAVKDTEEGSEDLRKVTSFIGGAFDQVKNSAASYALGIGQIATALFDGENAYKATMDAMDSFKRGNEALFKTIEAGKEAVSVEESLIEQEKLFLDLDRAIGMLTSSLEIQQAIAGDSTRSFDDMQEAAERALSLENERNALVVQRAERELEQLRLEIERKKNIAGEEKNLLSLREQEVELLNNLDAANAQYQTGVINGQKEILEIVRDRYEQELDFALDVSDRQKSINERLISSEQISLEEKKKVFKATEDLLNSSYENQIKLTENYIRTNLSMRGKNEKDIAEALKFVNIETLANLEDEAEVRKRLIDVGIADEITQNRIREIIIERKSALQDLRDIQFDLTKQTKEELESRTKAQLDNTQKIVDEELAYYDKLLEEQNQKAYEAEERKIQLKEDAKDASLQITQELADSEFQILQANLERSKQYQIDQLAIRDEREQDLLQSKLDKNLITQEEYENNRKALAQKIEQDRLKIEREAFEKKKKLDIAQAIINGALAVTKILAQTGVASPPLVAASIASTAIQVGTIAAQKFKRGGLINGASHEQGGVSALVDGKRPIEVEGGEVIINKKSAMMFRKELSAINQAGGGVPIFAKGGIVPKYASGGLVRSNDNSYDLERQAQMIINGINDKKVINVVSDTVSTYSRSKQIENNVSF